MVLWYFNAWSTLSQILFTMFNPRGTSSSIIIILIWIIQVQRGWYIYVILRAERQKNENKSCLYSFSAVFGQESWARYSGCTSPVPMPSQRSPSLLGAGFPRAPRKTRSPLSSFQSNVGFGCLGSNHRHDCEIVRK